MPALRSDPSIVGSKIVFDVVNGRNKVVATTDRGWAGVIAELAELPIGVYDVLRANGTVAGGATVDRRGMWRAWGRNET